jgi:hypothetical protein
MEKEISFKAIQNKPSNGKRDLFQSNNPIRFLLAWKIKMCNAKRKTDLVQALPWPLYNVSH